MVGVPGDAAWSTASVVGEGSGAVAAATAAALMDGTAGTEAVRVAEMRVGAESTSVNLFSAASTAFCCWFWFCAGRAGVEESGE